MKNMPLFQTTRSIDNHYSSDSAVVLVNGDAAALLKTLPDETVQLVITSPPYNLGKAYEDRVSIEKYLKGQKPIIAELARVLKKSGSICWQVGNFVSAGEVFPLDILYYQIFKDLGLRLRNRIVWHFGHGLHASRRFSGRYETILWFTKSDEYVFNLDPVRVPSKYPGKRHFKGPNKGKPSGNPNGKNPSDVWEILLRDWEQALWDIPNVKANHPEKTLHPCQYPVELAERCVLGLTDEDDWVLDPYAGVGTSLIAAQMHNRRAMGSEKEPEYFEVALERINALWAGTLVTRPMGKPVFVPTGKEKVAQVPAEWQTRQLPRLFEKKAKYK